jgi:exopolysaccharide production protein ExoQ
LLLSQSATAVVVCILLLAALSLRRILAWPIKSMLMAGIPASMLLSAAFAWLIQNKDAILTALGRSSTLTGRLPLWHAVKLEILDQPIFGHGFSAFWISSTAARLNERISWDAPNAHNSYLEVLLGLGVCGLFLLLMSLLQTLRLSWRAARSDQDATLLPLFFLLFLTLYSLTESTMLQPNSMLWMVYIGTSCWLVREQRRSLAASHEPVEQEHSTSGQFALSGTASS